MREAGVELIGRSWDIFDRTKKLQSAAHSFPARGGAHRPRRGDADPAGCFRGADKVEPGRGHGRTGSRVRPPAIGRIGAIAPGPGGSPALAEISNATWCSARFRSPVAEQPTI